MLLATSDWHPQQDLFLNTNAAQKGILYEASEKDLAAIGSTLGFVMGFPKNLVHANGETPLKKHQSRDSSTGPQLPTLFNR